MSKKLKSLTVYRRNIIPGNAGKEERQPEEIIISHTDYHESFDKPVKDIQYSHEGEPEQIIWFQYDANGFLVCEELQEGNGQMLSKKTFEVDPKGKIQKEMGHFADGAHDVTTYSYDEAGRLTEKVTIDEDGDLESKEIFEYEGEYLIRHAYMDSDDFLVKEVLMEYDEDGLIEQTIERDLHEGTEVRKEFEYDEKGQRRAYVVYNENDQVVEKVLLFHDESGRLTKVVDENRHEKNTTQMQYNQKGNVIQQEEYDRENNLLNRVERTFDEEGRMLESKIFIDQQGRGANQLYIMRNHYVFYSPAED
jgi:YD repeat-containing protein